MQHDLSSQPPRDSRPSLATLLDRTNDFAIKLANVNGSGSASANEMFARAVMRMGIPVAPRNIFPSNIQGLPTWPFNPHRPREEA